MHDIDFAVLPKNSDFEPWREEVKRRVESIGGKVISFGEVISNFLYKGVQINLFPCPSDDAGG